MKTYFVVKRLVWLLQSEMHVAFMYKRGSKCMCQNARIKMPLYKVVLSQVLSPLSEGHLNMEAQPYQWLEGPTTVLSL